MWRQKTAVSIVLAGALGGVLAVLFVFDPVTAHIFPTCPMCAVTGLYCPGCGTLRGCTNCFTAICLGRCG